MTRALPLLVVLAGCSSQRAELPAGYDYAAAAVERAAAAPRAPAAATAPPTFDRLQALEQELRGRHGRAAETHGLLTPGETTLDEALRDDARYIAWLGDPRTLAQLESVAWLRHPQIAAARSALEAKLEELDQVAYLAEVIAAYRTFTRTLRLPAGLPGPAAPGRPQATLAPYPSVDALRGELAARGVELAWQALRATIVARLADVTRASALARFAADRLRVSSGQRRLLEELLPAVRQRVETGRTEQANLVTLEAALADERSRETVAREDVRHAAVALARAVHAPVGASVHLAPEDPPAMQGDLAALTSKALSARPSLLALETRLERQKTLLRLGEVMTLTTTGVGAFAVERGRSGEAGVARDPRLMRTRPELPQRGSGFGPRTAWLSQLRHGVSELRSEVADRRRATTLAVSAAWADLVEAHERLRAHDDELVPLAQTAYESSKRAYESGRASFLDVFRAAQRRLERELGRAAAARDAWIARARLLAATGTGVPQ